VKDLDAIERKLLLTSAGYSKDWAEENLKGDKADKTDKTLTRILGENYLKLLLTTAGHSEEWTDANLNRVIWMLQSVPVEGDKETGRHPFSLADVDVDLLKRGFDNHRKAQRYGQKLRTSREKEFNSLMTPASEADEEEASAVLTMLFCFLVRENFRREKEMQDAMGENLDLVREVRDSKLRDSKQKEDKNKDDEKKEDKKKEAKESDEEKILKHVRRELRCLDRALEKASKKGNDSQVVKTALLQEAAQASWLRIQEAPWSTSEGVEEERAIRNFGFIFMAYRPSCWWFELFEMARKLIMVSAGIPRALDSVMSLSSEIFGFTDMQ
jgi:hypothetical protein